MSNLKRNLGNLGEKEHRVSWAEKRNRGIESERERKLVKYFCIGEENRLTDR